MIVNSVERGYIINPKLDMNALDPTKILASTSNGVHVYDIRNLNKRLFTQDNQLGSTTQCLWSPHRDLVFATASNDRRVYVTDMGEVDRHSMNEYNNIQQSLIVSTCLIPSLLTKDTNNRSETWTGTKARTTCSSLTTRTASTFGNW